MDQKKTCPLLLAADVSGRELSSYQLGVAVHNLLEPGRYGDAARRAVACPGPACAWYDAARECCAIVSIARRAV